MGVTSLFLLLAWGHSKDPVTCWHTLGHGGGLTCCESPQSCHYLVFNPRNKRRYLDLSLGDWQLSPQISLLCPHLMFMPCHPYSGQWAQHAPVDLMVGQGTASENLWDCLLAAGFSLLLQLITATLLGYRVARGHLLGICALPELVGKWDCDFIPGEEQRPW